MELSLHLRQSASGYRDGAPVAPPVEDAWDR